MKTLAHNTALALIATLTFVAAGTAQAEQPKALLVAPTPGYNLPKFGFNSYNIAGYGDRVTYVRWGGLASQLGLEPGDTILRVNGFPLTYHGAWNDALYQAMSSGGWVQLTIRDVRTGMVTYRQTSFGTPGYGPITAKSQVVGYPGQPYYPGDNCHGPQYGGGYPVGPITAKSVAGPGANKNHHGGPAPIAKQIAKWFDKD